MRYKHSITESKDTGLRILRVEDVLSGIAVNTVIPNDSLPAASVTAYVAARYSRSDKSVIELMTELVSNKTDSVAKMGAIFNTYGHASVADMSGVFCYIENIPSLYAARHFMESSVGAGMERSTRYQDFGNNSNQIITLFELGVDASQRYYSEANESFMTAQKIMLSKYNFWKEHLTQEFGAKYDVDTKNKKQLSALNARVFDTARSFLPWGSFNKTSLGYLTSVREWSRLIGIYKGANDSCLNNIGHMLELLLAPNKDIQRALNFQSEADELIKYTKAEETTSSNLKALKNWLAVNSDLKNTRQSTNSFTQLGVEYHIVAYKSGAFKTLEGYISILYPHVSGYKIESVIRGFSNEQLIELSHIIFKDHNHHNQMPIMARNGDYEFKLNCTFAEMRDLNRHRSMGRYCPYLLSGEDVINGSKFHNWILTPYLNSFNNAVKTQFFDDILDCNNALADFEKRVSLVENFDVEICKQLWLFCMHTPMYLAGSAKDVNYLTHLRVRPGGHISYRILAKQIANSVAHGEFLMNHLHIVGDIDVDPDNRDQFLDRS
jgi:thymidylate synthase ThyX